MDDINTAYTLSDRYTAETGRIFLTGIQALVRLPLMQKRLDVRNGLNTAGLISGYRGSPLGAYDQELWRNRRHLEAEDIVFEPGINEDLGATAVWGTQLTDYYREDMQKDGVFAYWYGKAHGVDRSADVFRQANVQGTAKHGGVLAFCGDDHGAESSMFSHQTDQIFEAAIMPILFPSSVEEFLTLGLAGIAMSRFSGLWIGFKTITETVESAASIDLPPYPDFVRPDIPVPPHGFNYDVHLQWPSQRMEYERRMIEERVPALHAFVYANKIDRMILQAPEKRLGIVSVGKAHTDLMAALRLVGLTDSDLKAAGISIFKVGMSWPLEPRGIADFADGMQSLLVVEEKRPQLEKQIKEQLFNLPDSKRPEILGKCDRVGNVLLPEIWTFTPEIVASAIGRWLEGSKIGDKIAGRLAQLAPPCTNTSDKLVARTPYFCSGCPHNISTKVPEGSKAGAGIGCHIMVLGQGRRSETFTHMGGEGVQWVGLHRFSKQKHMFQNLGDGTYIHSGSLAVRQAVVSGVNITYKILFNDAVAMVGGQPVEGALHPGQIAQQMLAEGVQHVALVSDDIEKYRDDKTIPEGVTRHDRLEMDILQKRLRDIPGVTVLIYDQTCAAEKRRRRKKGLMDDPQKRLFIHADVCEGCGDCSVQSNCISIEPAETPFGRKRKINQSTCNKDFSCVNGFCPSFVTVKGGALRTPDTADLNGQEQTLAASLPTPGRSKIDGEYSVLIAGIGGTGVLTIGAILSMAAHLENKGTSTLDFTGLSQKNGAVTAHVKIANTPDDIKVPRIVDGGADLLLGCDMVTAATSIAKIRPQHTKLVINTAEVPVARFTRDNDMIFPARETRDEFTAVGSDDTLHFLDATRLARQIFGDAIAANLFIVGFALQKGYLPVSEAAIVRAIELNAVAIAFNRRALLWGRIAAHDAARLNRLIAPKSPVSVAVLDTLQAITAHRRDHLTVWQNAGYAARYQAVVDRVFAREQEVASGSDVLSKAVAKTYAKLLAYKDEYEIARLYSAPEFRAKLAEEFAGSYTLALNLAPPMLSRRDAASGRPKKREFGPWIFPVLALLAKGKVLRGTPFDVFGYHKDRRLERALITTFEDTLDTVLTHLSADRLHTALSVIACFDGVKGYGPVKEATYGEAMVQLDELMADYAGRTPMPLAAE